MSWTTQLRWSIYLMTQNTLKTHLDGALLNVPMWK